MVFHQNSWLQRNQIISIPKLISAFNLMDLTRSFVQGSTWKEEVKEILEANWSMSPEKVKTKAVCVNKTQSKSSKSTDPSLCFFCMHIIHHRGTKLYVDHQERVIYHLPNSSHLISDLHTWLRSKNLANLFSLSLFLSFPISLI